MLFMLGYGSVCINRSADSPVLFSKDSTPYGISYGDWIAKWWQWNIGISPAEHPRDHFTPQGCSINQNGSVWFLPDILSGKEERTCPYLMKKPYLFHYSQDSVMMTTPIQTSKPMKACVIVQWRQEYRAISSSLDGSKLQVNQFRTQTRFFDLTIPKDNFANLVPGKF